MYKFHKDHTEPANQNAVFVFGSNLAARHGGGAALLAAQKYGASKDIAEGISGRSYAIPTKDKNIQTMSLDEIKQSVDRFISHAAANPDVEFFMTRVGCVLAGYQNSDIAVMFKGAPSNIDFPEEWKDYLKVSEKVMVLRTSKKDGKAYNDFQWPAKGMVECPDWRDDGECGHGLHGIVWPDGGWSHLKTYDDALWQVVLVNEDEITEIDGKLGGKVKFPRGEVIYSGEFAVAFNMVAKSWLEKLPALCAALMEAGVDPAKKSDLTTGEDNARIGSSGNGARIGSSGNDAQIGSSGYGAQIGSSGNGARIGSSGNDAQIGSSGYDAQIGSSGYGAQIGSSGYGVRIGSSGNGARIGSSGYGARIDAEGENAVVACAGSVWKFKVGQGGCISVPYHDGNRTRFAVGYVGENIEANTWYAVNSEGVFQKV